MSLLSEQDRAVVAGRLAAITAPVRLLFFTQTIGAPESTLVARQIVDEIASLSDAVTIEEVNFILEKERAAQYGIAAAPGFSGGLLPAIGLRGTGSRTVPAWCCCGARTTRGCAFSAHRPDMSLRRS